MLKNEDNDCCCMLSHKGVSCEKSGVLVYLILGHVLTTTNPLANTPLVRSIACFLGLFCGSKSRSAILAVEMLATGCMKNLAADIAVKIASKWIRWFGPYFWCFAPAPRWLRVCILPKSYSCSFCLLFKFQPVITKILFAVFAIDPGIHNSLPTIVNINNLKFSIYWICW